jgi:LuxR family maltose regulon positive regulatory protein
VILLPAAAAVPWWSILLATWAARVAILLNDVERAEWLLSHAQRDLGRYPDCGMLAQWVQKEERALEAAHGGAAVLRQPLTEAELRVLELVPTHLTLEEIGRNLCISRNTVKTHLKVIYGKLSVSSRSAAVARAQAVGLIGRHAARG